MVRSRLREGRISRSPDVQSRPTSGAPKLRRGAIVRLPTACLLPATGARMTKQEGKMLATMQEMPKPKSARAGPGGKKKSRRREDPASTTKRAATTKRGATTKRVASTNALCPSAHGAAPPAPPRASPRSRIAP